jgi:hypothetical protein
MVDVVEEVVDGGGVEWQQLKTTMRTTEWLTVSNTSEPRPRKQMKTMEDPMY